MNKILALVLLVVLSGSVIAMTDQEHMDRIKEQTWGRPER